MKKPTLKSALAIAALAAASLFLPATASAGSFDETVKKVHDRGDRSSRHESERSYRERDHRQHGANRWAPSRYRHDQGHHYGHHHRYYPIERHRHLYDDIRVRIFYDLHL